MDGMNDMGAGQDMTGGAAADDTEDQGGYTVELHVAADGSMTLDVETDSQEEGEGGAAGAEGAEPSGQPVKSLREAMALIMDIVKNGGQMQASGDADFEAGVSGKPTPMSTPGQMA